MSQMISVVGAVVLAIGQISACKTIKRQAERAGILLAQADGLSEFPSGHELPIGKSSTLELSGEEENVGLAIAGDVLWSRVRQMRQEVLNRNATPYLLVASGPRVGSLELFEELKGDAIRVIVSVDGKLCVAPPNTREAKCVQRADKKHVDRAYTRQLVREAVKEYRLNDVIVEAPEDLEWGDLVRAVDGARTCCFSDKVRVHLSH